MNNRTYGLAARAARGMAVLGLLVSGTAIAQPPNDECATAIALANGLNGPFTNVAATNNILDPPMTCGGGGNDVWFTYTAACPGVYTFDTCTATGVFHDTVMEVFTGTCGALVLSDPCNDDMGAGACPINQFLSSVSHPMNAGETAIVRVGGFLGTMGAFDVNVTPPSAPSNDECASAGVLVPGANAVSNNCATTSAGVPAACAANGRDVWYTYTAGLTGTATLSMCAAAGGSGTFDTVLTAYTGTCGALVQAACNDDTCGLQSQITFAITAATTYRVRLAGFGTPGAQGTGSIFLSEAVAPPPTTDFGDAPTGAGIAAHTSETSSGRLGTVVTGDLATVTPSWYGDAGDDCIVSKSALFPGSVGATIVVNATNPSGTFTDFCRIWVDRNATLGWSTAIDALPTQTASVGPGGTNFTFGPFTYSASAPASPKVRVRLSFNPTGVS